MAKPKNKSFDTLKYASRAWPVLSGGDKSYPTSDIKRRSKLTLKEQIEKYIKHIGKQSPKDGAWLPPPKAPIPKKRKGDRVKHYANGGGVRPANNEYS